MADYTEEEIKSMFDSISEIMYELVYQSFKKVVLDAPENINKVVAIENTLLNALKKIEESKYSFNIDDTDKFRVCDSYVTMQ